MVHVGLVHIVTLTRSLNVCILVALIDSMGEKNSISKDIIYGDKG